MVTALGVAAVGVATQASAQVTFYEGDNFHGRTLTVDRVVPNFAPLGFNDRARSAIVSGGSWEACEDADFRGRCVILRPGSYDSLARMDMYKRISSVRPTDEQARWSAPAPVAALGYQYYQRPNEPLYEAQVTSVHAVIGPPERRCWVERQQVYEDRQPNVPGAIVGGIIGGVLGHQIGGGHGRDVATAGGAVAGAAIGANVGRDDGMYDRDVQRCETVQGNAQPDYWDVTYNFRGTEHRVQLSAPPGPTIAVNALGEPRG
ncbi:MAG TPA: beta/gamma crystallin-related protein [Casimicrobiaceae bacterium]|nr:beta/gamma crystallin-related protein [Casimicrobiaceae bacterium]